MKYHNVPTRVNGIRFDSMFESRVYDKLTEIFSNTNFLVSCQYPLILAAKNENFPATTWKVDFSIMGQNGKPLFFIEAKAAATLTEAFKIKMRWLAGMSPETYERCLFVFPSHDFGGWDKHSSKCLSIDFLEDYLSGINLR